MKQQSDVFTVDAFAAPRRGRPRKPDAKTGAQRAREFRLRKKFNFLISVTRNEKGEAK